MKTELRKILEASELMEEITFTSSNLTQITLEQHSLPDTAISLDLNLNIRMEQTIVSWQVQGLHFHSILVALLLMVTSSVEVAGNFINSEEPQISEQHWITARFRSLEEIRLVPSIQIT
jgi:hypothetical protein